MNIVFMGTPAFASVALEKILKSEHKVSLVITQPDKPKGRSKKLLPSDVKLVAEKNGIQVLQPERIKKDRDVIETLKSIKPDIIVVAAYGQILSKEILDIPKYYCINIHASLLPKYRGAAPINWSIINGDEYTGITIMKMDVGLDTGDIISQRTINIELDDDAITLTEKLSRLGAEMIVDTICNIASIQLTKQNEDESTYACMLDKNLSNLCFSDNVKSIHDRIRGIVLWPTASISIKNKKHKIFKSEFEIKNIEGEAGEIIELSKKGIGIKALDGVLYIKEIQPEGKKRMPASAYIQGYDIKIGDKVE